MITKEVRSSILMTAQMQEPWTTAHMVCPVCFGGGSGERSFNLTVEPACAKFVCHRASCGFKGYLSFAPSGYRLPEPKSKIREYTGEVVPLAEIRKVMLRQQYRIEDWHLEQLGATRDVETGRVVYPIYGYNGLTKGHLLRTYDGRKPKTLTYRSIDNVPMTAWYMAKDIQSRMLVIVEDVLSAVRVAGVNVNAVALLGTHMSMDMVHEIRGFIRAAGITDVVLALDADAFSTALDTAQRYKLILSMRVVKLERDLKDEPDNKIREVINYQQRTQTTGSSTEIKGGV